MKKVICIGSALKDIFLPTGDGHVTETPEDIMAKRKITFELGAKYRIEDRFTSAGGGALNAAIGLSRLGVAAAPYALIGGDATGMWIRNFLVKNGVQTEMLRQVSEAQTDLSMVLVDRKSGERVIFVNRDLQETLTIDGALMDDQTVLFVSALSGNWHQNYSIIRNAVATQGALLAYNPGQSNLDDDMDAVYQMIAVSTYLFVNKDEAMQIVVQRQHERARLDDVVYLLEQLRAHGAKTVVITAGLAGAWMLHGEQIYFVPSSGARPVDATGAGDAFTSGVLAAFVHGEMPATACAWGAANATRVVQFYGSNKGLLSLAMMHTHAELFLSKVKKTACTC